MKPVGRLFISIALALAMGAVNAQASDVYGVFQIVRGQVKVISAQTGKVKMAKPGMKVFPRDTVLTGKESLSQLSPFL